MIKQERRILKHLARIAVIDLAERVDTGSHEDYARSAPEPKQDQHSPISQTSTLPVQPNRPGHRQQEVLRVK